MYVSIPSTSRLNFCKKGSESIWCSKSWHFKSLLVFLHPTKPNQYLTICYQFRHVYLNWKHIVKGKAEHRWYVQLSYKGIYKFKNRQMGQRKKNERRRKVVTRSQQSYMESWKIAKSSFIYMEFAKVAEPMWNDKHNSNSHN